MQNKDFKNLNFTILGTESTLEGELSFAGDTIVNSRVVGTINIENEGSLTLERKGSLEGTINCHDLELFGSVEGTINASGAVRIRSGASMSGVINAKSLSVFPGAILNMDAHAEDITDSNNGQEA